MTHIGKDKMGDTDEGPSSAAQSAQQDETETSPGLFSRLVNVFTGPATSEENHEAPRENVNAAGAMLGMLNLRRMRVEDVSIPKPDIVAVPVTITKD